MSYSKDEARKAIKKLVEFYDTNQDKLKEISETDTRAKFIDRIFESLGWDVWGRTIPDEVQREEPVKGKESTKKKADYGFRIGGITRLIVEAKALGEDLDRKDYTKQAISYAFNKACSWAVLTDFKTIKIFYVDRSGGFPFYLIKLNDVRDFEENFEILWFLSKESFLHNSLESEATKRGMKKEKILVDKQLLEDLRKWRAVLSKDVRRRYGDKYTPQVIDEIVQRIIDRLIFIRKAEDSELEERKLDQLTRRFNDNTYLDLMRIFAEYKEKYNSKLFGVSKATEVAAGKTEKDEVDKIIISNSVIAEVVSGMYIPPGSEIEYNFAEIPADILGNIYEQYLAFMLRETPSSTKLEGGIAHRKEQGIYYTPTYIVDYVVRNTIGEILRGMKPENVKDIGVLDPACGSGSFLIKAFDTINEFLSRNSRSDSQISLGAESENGFSKNVKILQNNIFGVDLDPRAVEIAQLNLLLKIAEKGRKLPLLQKNIRCGNSLIDDKAIAGDRAFNWDTEFPEIKKKGWFDVIIGNPPYFKIFEDDPLNKTIDYQEVKSGMMNVSALFINKSLKLLRKGGYLGMIVPKMLAFTDSWDKIREKLLRHFKIIKVVDCGKAFKGVLLEQIIFILKNESQDLETNMITVGELNNQIITETAQVPQKLCLEENSIHLEPNPIAYEIKEKMEKSKLTLGDISQIILGLGIQGKEFFVKDYKEGFERALRGVDIQRYFIRGSKFYNPSDENIIKIRDTVDKFKTPHIVSQRIVAHIQDHIKLTSAIDEEGLFSFNTVTNIFITDKKYQMEFVLALVNSNAVQYYTYKFIYNNAIRSMDFYKAYAKKIPLPQYKKKEQDAVTQLVRDLMILHKRLFDLGGQQTNEAEKLKEEIDRTQKEVDNEIYALYNLSENEIEIIEKP